MVKHSTRALVFGGLALGLALVLQACAKDDSGTPPAANLPSATAQSDFFTPTDVDVDLFLHDQSLDVEAIQDSAHNAPPVNRADEALIFWEFDDGAGNVSATGTLVDPRIATSEFDESGNPNPVNSEKATSALLSVTLPNTGGWVHLYEAPPGSTGTHTTSLFGGAEIAKAYVQKITQRFVSTLFPGSTHPPSSNDGSIYDGILQHFGINHVQTASACGTFSLLFVGDGYTAADMDKFHNDVKSAISTMSSLPVYKDHWNAFNIWSQDFVSKDSGITDPGDAMHTKATKSTAFNVSFGADANSRRCTVPRPGIPTGTSLALAAGKIATSADVTVIIANASEYAGCAIPSQRIISQSANSDAPRVLAHELGHSLFYLADEYEYGVCNPANASAVNVTNHLMPLPWQVMVNTTEIPTTSGGPDTVGAFVGGNYCKAGVWHPSSQCLMKELASAYCPVCTCQVERTVIAKQVSQSCAMKNTLPARCDGSDAGTEAGTPEGGGTSDASATQKEAGAPLYDTCVGRSDGVYCSQLADYSAIVCQGNSIKYGLQCPSPKKCTGPNGAGQLMCDGAPVGGSGGGGGTDSGTTQQADSCNGRADGVYCSQLADYSAIMCKGGSIAGGQQCGNNQKCVGPNGAGTMIQCQ